MTMADLRELPWLQLRSLRRKERVKDGVPLPRRDLEHPRTVLADVVDLFDADDDPLEVAYNTARKLLDSEAIAVVYSVHESRVYFLACKASDLVSKTMSLTPLAMALPGMPEYRGPGAYLYEGNSRFVSVVVHCEDADGRERLMSYAGEQKAVSTFASEHTEEVYYVSGEIRRTAFIWQICHIEQERRQRAFAMLLMRIGGAFALGSGVACLLFVMLGLFSSVDISGLQRENHADLMQSAAELKGFSSQPLAEDLSEILKASAFAVGQNGQLLKVRKDRTGRGSRLSWQAKVPDFTDRMVLQSLGDSVRTAPSALEEKQILVSKGVDP